MFSVSDEVQLKRENVPKLVIKYGEERRKYTLLEKLFQNLITVYLSIEVTRRRQGPPKISDYISNKTTATIFLRLGNNIL